MTAQVQRLIYTRQGQHQHTLLFQVAITLAALISEEATEPTI
jgi:hypothetical protein